MRYCRRVVTAISLLGFVAMPFAVNAQPTAKISRIGLLLLSPTFGNYVDGFRQAMRDQGYREGRNLLLEIRAAEGRADRLADLAADLVRSRVDIMVVESGAAAIAAKKATQTIPIVMGVVGDPLSAGLVTNLARPGGNITGLTLQAPELSAKRLQILKEVLPKTGLVSIIYNATNPSSRAFIEETKVAAKSLRLELQLVEVRAPADLDAAFRAVKDARPSAFMTLADGMMFGSRSRIAEFAANNRLPGIFPEREFAEAGGLMSYGPNLNDVWRRSAIYVDKILKGMNPGDLPVEAPAKFELVLNLKTAKLLGMTVDSSLLTRVDGVIE